LLFSGLEEQEKELLSKLDPTPVPPPEQNENDERTYADVVKGETEPTE
jgi:hypothetical protein